MQLCVDLLYAVVWEETKIFEDLKMNFKIFFTLSMCFFVWLVYYLSNRFKARLESYWI